MVFNFRDEEILHTICQFYYLVNNYVDDLQLAGSA